jgi:hypothetical protein
LRKAGSKERIRQFLLANIGSVVTATQIREAIGAEVSEWARRLRELREQEGWPIRTHHDDARLKPGEYILESTPPEKKDVAFARGISTKLRAEVLDRNGFTCQMCGLTPGDTDPETARKVRLHIGHIVDKTWAGRMNCPIFAHSVRPAIRGPRTSPARSRPASGCSRRCVGPGRMSSAPFMRG